MIAGEPLSVRWRKVRTPYGSMPRKIRGRRSRKQTLTESVTEKDTASSLKEVQARVKRRGKSSPLAEQFARHEKPHVVQDRTEEGQPARQKSSGIVALRRMKIRRAFGEIRER